MFGMLPQDLDSIELWAIGRQIVQIQAMFGPLPPLLIYRGALMYAGVVDQDDSWNLVCLSSDLIEERDYVITCRRSLLRSPGQQSIVAQCSEHVHALPVRERFDGPGLADFPPSVLHRRIRTETRFVEVEQLALLFVVKPGQRLDHFAGALERFLISLFLNCTDSACT